jgi:hypothetical protein
MVHSTLERRAKFSSRQAAEAIRSGESFYDGKMDELPGWYREQSPVRTQKGCRRGPARHIRIAAVILTGILWGAWPVTAAPKFEVASVKLCKATDAPAGRMAGPGENASPDRLMLRCQTLKSLIEWAYISNAGGHFHPWPQVKSGGGPAWIDSDLYQIEAKAESPQSLGMRNGPMLQALLEDRF